MVEAELIHSELKHCIGSEAQWSLIGKEVSQALQENRYYQSTSPKRPMPQAVWMAAAARWGAMPLMVMAKHPKKSMVETDEINVRHFLDKALPTMRKRPSFQQFFSEVSCGRWTEAKGMGKLGGEQQLHIVAAYLLMRGRQFSDLPLTTMVAQSGSLTRTRGE